MAKGVHRGILLPLFKLEARIYIMLCCVALLGLKLRSVAPQLAYRNITGRRIAKQSSGDAPGGAPITAMVIRSGSFFKSRVFGKRPK